MIRSIPPLRDLRLGRSPSMPGGEPASFPPSQPAAPVALSSASRCLPPPIARCRPGRPTPHPLLAAPLPPAAAHRSMPAWKADPHPLLAAPLPRTLLAMPRSALPAWKAGPPPLLAMPLPGTLLAAPPPRRSVATGHEGIPPNQKKYKGSWARVSDHICISIRKEDFQCGI
ncbi:hypothetical protein U9M48_032453 [Paspalum notatum var. saurae]|uniref:Uncharacterized protein n=1 Tax=Paspalum notatum var. saurae TaxID=547442 RepID=A0AAQ3X5F3_PASNO